MSWGYVAVAAGTVVAGGLSANASRQAGRQGARAADAATAESARQFDTTNANFAPWRVTGGGALNQLAGLFGLPTTTPEAFTQSQDQLVGDTMLPAGATFVDKGKGWYDVNYNGRRVGYLRPGGSNGRFVNDTGTDLNSLRPQTGAGVTPGGTPNMNAFFQSPGYQFRRDEGTRGLERTAAARGGAFSGNALRALAEFNSGLASQEFGNYFNQLASIAGLGQTATNATAAYGADHAANAGRNALYAGDARASGIIGQANAYGNAIQGLGGLAGYAWGGPRQPYQMNGEMSDYAGSGINPFTGRRG